MKQLLIFIGLSLALITPASANQAALESAIAGKHRTADWVSRDEYRNPLQTLMLFDVQPNHTVVEIWPGGGWYTEILAPYLAKKGQLIAAQYDSEDTQASYRPKVRAAFEKKLKAKRSVYKNVQLTSLMIDESTQTLEKGAAQPGTVDRVVTFRNAHGWAKTGTTNTMLEHFFDILKPGGKLGIVQHMADSGQDWLSRNIGYVGRDYIINAAVKAGFQLEAEGYFNQNPLDNKRYEIGVWQLPPSLRGLKTDEEKAPYRAIGESERMTLVFVKAAN